MKKSSKTYSIFLIAFALITLMGIVFCTLSLCLSYDFKISNIRLNNAFSILFIVFSSLCFATPIILSIITKPTGKITRTINGTLFFKIASGFLIASLLPLMVYDSILVVKEFWLLTKVYVYTGSSLFACFKQYFELWRFLRILLSFPLIGHLSFTFLPKEADVPRSLKTVFHVCAVFWPIVTPIMYYFYPTMPDTHPIPEFFKVTFSVLFIMLTLFFLFEFKWIYFEPGIRVYSAITAITSMFAFIVSVSTIISVIGKLTIYEMSISIFEVIVSLVLAFFVLAKWIETYKTIKIVAKQENQ